jgi:hypothetical protein
VSEACLGVVVAETSIGTGVTVTGSGTYSGST